jgi:hypothetical protein
MHVRARVALLIQHATRLRHILTSLVTPLALPNFSILYINGTTFGKKFFNIKYVFIFSTTFV